jgi:hypothetical protein
MLFSLLVYFLPLLFVWNPAPLSMWSNGVAACVMFAWYPYMHLRQCRVPEYRCLSFGAKMLRLRRDAKVATTTALLPTLLMWLYMVSASELASELASEAQQHQRTAAMFAAVWFGMKLSALMMVSMSPLESVYSLLWTVHCGVIGSGMVTSMWIVQVLMVSLVFECLSCVSCVVWWAVVVSLLDVGYQGWFLCNRPMNAWGVYWVCCLVLRWNHNFRVIFHQRYGDV